MQPVRVLYQRLDFVLGVGDVGGELVGKREELLTGFGAIALPGRKDV